jgi:hypothetical protein
VNAIERAVKMSRRRFQKSARLNSRTDPSSVVASTIDTTRRWQYCRKYIYVNANETASPMLGVEFHPPTKT